MKREIAIGLILGGLLNVLFFAGTGGFAQQAPPPDLSAGIVAQAAYKGWLEGQISALWTSAIQQQSLTATLPQDEANIAILQKQVSDLQAQVATLLAGTTVPQVIHVESEKFTVSTPACTNANGCIQNTSDTAPPAVGSLKVVLQQGMSLTYNVTATVAGNYALTVRLNGVCSVHFETPAGIPVSGEIVDTGTQGTFTAPNAIPLLAATQQVVMVVDTVGTGVPSANWFELTKQ